MDDKFLDNKYTKWYYELVQKAKDRNLSKNEGVYIEEHHIIPKSLGGCNSKSNLVLLFAREHYIVHRLLTKMTTGENKRNMCMALWCMVTINECEKFNNISKSKIYDIVKNEYTTNVSGKNHFNYGLTRSEETKQKIRAKRKLQVADTEAYVRASLKQKTLIWMNNGTNSKRVYPNEIEDYEKNGYTKGRLNNYLTDKFREEQSKRASEQWSKMRQKNITGNLTKV